MEMIFGLILLVAGICNIIDPYLAWKMSKGEYKNVEPSDEALKWTRMSGFILIGAAVYYFFVGM